MRRALSIAGLSILALVVAGVMGAPRLSAWYVRTRALPKVAERLGCEISHGRVSVRYGRAELSDLIVRCPNDGAQPLLAAAHVAFDFAPLQLVRGRLEIEEVIWTQAAVSARRMSDGRSNVQTLLERLRARSASKSPRGARSGGRLRIGSVRLASGTILLTDAKHEVRLRAEKVQGELVHGPGVWKIILGDVQLDSPRVPSTVALSKVEVAGRLTAARRTLPSVRVEGGHVKLLPRLSLTGIQGTVTPAGTTRVRIAFEGSYGGATARLWEAQGWLDPVRGRGDLEVRAERFNLGRIESILRDKPIILPQQTTIDGWLKLLYADGALSFDGALELQHLNLFHPGLARAPVLDLSGNVHITGREAGQVLEVSRFDVESRGLAARLNLRIDRSRPERVISGRLVVPPVKCQQVLDALPPALVPALQGFRLAGLFAVDVHTHIDFAKLDDLVLDGSVDRKRCKVLEAPPAMSAKRLEQSFDHTVESAPGEALTFTIGPESADFVPFDMISPNIIGALLTTEDAGFFRHRGFIPSQFRAALSRNLKRGNFSLGASTISMQMVKNVLLSGEKTLARKLQEMFLVWYLEQSLSKERLMEIYLNAIEFGPGIFGIGRATRHYFGKHPIDISPLEAAFFATILPNPRQRYVHYCHGALSPKWDSYVRRVLRKVHARGHITDEALAAAEQEQLVFARDTSSLSEASCRRSIDELREAWVEEHRRRLKEAVIQAAPHQLPLYLTSSAAATTEKSSRAQHSRR